MDCTGVYDDNGNLTNVIISAEKKAEILSSDFTGSGTSTDPYQVNSSLGFWFMSKFVTLSNKYVELNCDVILNDEQFDENGNACGGDGVVYSWEPIGCSLTEFNGNNNCVKGLYINDSEKSYVGLFGCGLAKVENLNFLNTYVCGLEYVSAIGGSIGSKNDCVDNVNVLNGYIKGDIYVAGVTAVVTEIYNCKNYATVICNIQITGGICAQSMSLISRCENYGKICYAPDEQLKKNMSLGGIVGSCYSAEYCNNYGKIFVRKGYINVGGICGSLIKQISYCNNYGDSDIEMISNYAGGICGGASSNNSKIQFCNNYGNAETTRGFGGICGFVDHDKLTIDHCNFYGKIVAYQSCGIFFGAGGVITNCGVYGVLKGEIVECLFVAENYLDIVIVNCKVDCQSVRICYIVGTIAKGGYQGTSDNVTISNLEIKISQATKFYFFGKQCIEANINIKNVDITIITNSRCDVYWCSTVNFNNDTTCFADSIYVKVNSQNGDAVFNTYSSSSGKIVINGVLFELNGATKSEKQYYGSSFGNFYVSWRTGKIGLKALDGVGYFQGAIDETWLTNNGFVKKG